MKKITLLSLLLFAVHFALHAQVTYSTIPDFLTGVPSGSIYDSKNISAYSMSNLSFTDGMSSLYVYSWDIGGFGWVRKKQGTSVILDQGYIATPYALSTTDIAIVDITRNGGPSTFAIALAYRNSSGVFVDIYQCNLVGVSTGPTILLSSTASSARVSLDAHKLHNLAAAWDNADGYIHTRTIDVANGVFTTGTEKLLQLPGAPALMLPDIAISHPTSTNNGQTMIHYVAMNTTRNRVYEFSMPYTVISGGGGPVYTATQEDQMLYGGGSAMFSNYPKIDCPDNYVTDDWTYVVPEVYSSTSNDSKIRISRRMGTTPPQQATLNDGTFGLYPIISGPGAISTRPCVGYINDGTGVNVLWSCPLQGLGWGSYNYIGLFFDFSNSVANGVSYKVVDYAQRPYGIPGIGISTQNDNTEDAFTAYFEGQPQQIYYKNIPWVSTGFRPGNTTALAAVSTDKLMVESYPNPFARDITLRVDDAHSGKTLNVTLSDITGKAIATFTGDINAINAKLSKVSAALSIGTFFVNIQMNETGEHSTLKIVKL